MDFDPEIHPHRRFNALTGEWILVSPHRTQRPWLGQRESASRDTPPVYDPDCYLCPGNRRAGGAVNPPYTDTFAFTNDYSALLPDTPLAHPPSPDLLRCEPVRGECRVLCFCPQHNLTLAEMSVEQIGRVVRAWTDQVTDLGARYRWVQVFENRGAMMGASNPHPHGQIWAGNWIPVLPEREDASQRDYAERHGSVLLVDYVRLEVAEQRRVVEENQDWLMLVPYWATWPFELLLVARRPVRRLPELTAGERDSLAEILRRSLIRYDNLFETDFPYSMGWHGAPTDEGDYAHWQLHAHFYPPLLRSATVRKFMVGYELLAEAQRDLTAEQAAQRLRDLPVVHFRAGRGHDG